MGKFSAFNLKKQTIGCLAKQGLVDASPIQETIIPRALRGESLICQSPTGSGKTHAYLVPIIDRVDENLPRLQSVIVCPSRELARQVYEFARPFQKYYQHLKIRLLTSEAEKSDNLSGLSQAPQIVIGTPGRLKDLLSGEYALDLHGVKSLVLDEADMLMELGYFNDIDAVYSLMPKEVQVMVFSATLDEGLREKLSHYVSSDFIFEGGKDQTAPQVKHHLVDIKHKDPVEAVKNFLVIRNPYLCLVFSSRKEEVRRAYDALKEADFSVTMFSGDLDQRQRRQVIRLIKENRYQIIVSSDLLSRGIDIDDVSDVVSLDLPGDLEYYYHRAGRTGRFGKSGDSWVFYDSDHEEKAKALLQQGVPFDYYELKAGSLVIDPVGLAPKTKLKKKKAFSPEEQREVKIAKAKSHTDKVKPAYKKKMRWEVERVKNKYRRKAIQKSVNRTLHRKAAEQKKETK